MSAIRVNIIFHSNHGHTRKLAEAIVEGARTEQGAEVQMIEVERAAQTHVTNCDALVLGCPTHMGNVSSQMKEFIDTVISQIWMNGGIPGVVASCFTCSGSLHGGKEFTLFALLSTLFQLGTTVVSLPPRQIPENQTLGFAGGIGGTSLSSDPSERPSAEERATATALGAHVAAVARQLKNGADAARD